VDHALPEAAVDRVDGGIEPPLALRLRVGEEVKLPVGLR
jgi:hypothetical protein